MASLATIKPRDIVEVDKRGRKFLAIVTEKRQGELTINPIAPNISYFNATSREIVKHWRLTKNGRQSA
jgi:hypothetical protein